MRWNTDPRAKPSCRLKVAEKPTIGIVCASFGGWASTSGLWMSG